MAKRPSVWRRSTRLAAALFLLGAVSACGSGSSLPRTATAPVQPDATGAGNDTDGAGSSDYTTVSEANAWREDEVHASLIPSRLGLPFPPGLRYEPYLAVDNSDDQAPVMRFGRNVHVGADVAPPAGTLGAMGSLGGAALSGGEVSDGIGAAVVLDYLRTMALGNLEGGLAGLQKWNVPPNVQVVGTETEERYIRLTRRAGQIVNAALPFTKRLRLEYVDLPVTDERAERHYENGQWGISVRFVPKSSPWWSGAEGDELGRTRVLKPVLYSERRQRREVDFGSGVVRSDIVIDPEAVASFSDEELTHVLVHEFLHAVGFMSHTDRARFRSTLNEEYVRGNEPRSLIHPIDRAGLLAAYSRFTAGTPPEFMTFESLGPWSDTSRHARGDLPLGSGDLAFGVAFINGLPQPWAFGPAPAGDLVGDAALSGTVRWKGALVGMTPAGLSVSGASSLIVDLSKVRNPAYLTEPDGTLRFAGMQFEDGTTWGDGDLAYSIEVKGDRFERVRSSFVISAAPGEQREYLSSGEDFGVVTGAFFGDGHEGMGGVLERHDLSAAFGGRQ